MEGTSRGWVVPSAACPCLAPLSHSGMVSLCLQTAQLSSSMLFLLFPSELLHLLLTRHRFLPSSHPPERPSGAQVSEEFHLPLTRLSQSRSPRRHPNVTSRVESCHFKWEETKGTKLINEANYFMCMSSLIKSRAGNRLCRKIVI